MWPNMMSHNIPPNMAQGGSIFPFFPPLCQTQENFNQFMPSNIMDSQIWRGPQPSQVWRGEQSSFTEMMKNIENAED